jgi:hypothetical protein
MAEKLEGRPVVSEHPGHREGLRERLLARVKRGFHITDTDVADLLREAVEALQRVEPERDEWKEVAEFKQAEAMKYHNLYAALEGALTARAEECRALADKTRSEDVIGAAVYRRIAKELDVLRLAVSAAGGSAPSQEAEERNVEDALHEVFTSHGIASRSDYSMALVGDLIHWAADMCRQSRTTDSFYVPVPLADSPLRHIYTLAMAQLEESRDQWKREAESVRSECDALKAENERLKTDYEAAIATASNYLRDRDAFWVSLEKSEAEVESLKAKLAAPSAGEGQ